MMNVYLVHGFNVRDEGAGSTDKLKPFLEGAGHRVIQYDYDWTGVIRVRLCNHALATGLAGIAEPGSVAIGHSNGCAIIHEASHQGARFERVIYLNPALDSDAEFAPHIRHADIWYSPEDYVVWLARFLRKHSWGDMGRVGYRGDYRKGINSWNYKVYYPNGKFLHSTVFKDDALNVIGPQIVKQVRPV